MPNKLTKIILPSLGIFFLPVLSAQAICPVCIVAVGAGLGLSEYLGIDDSIAGVWIGGLLVSLIIWTINWFNKKNWLTSAKKIGEKFNNQNIRDVLITIIYYAMVIWPLIAQSFIGNPLNKLWGIDKLLLGISAGSLGLLGGTKWYENIKRNNDGHAWFPFQKVAWPFGALLILSLVFYLLTR